MPDIHFLGQPHPTTCFISPADLREPNNASTTFWKLLVNFIIPCTHLDIAVVEVADDDYGAGTGWFRQALWWSWSLVETVAAAEAASAGPGSSVEARPAAAAEAPAMTPRTYHSWTQGQQHSLLCVFQATLEASFQWTEIMSPLHSRCEDRNNLAANKLICFGGRGKISKCLPSLQK